MQESQFGKHKISNCRWFYCLQGEISALSLEIQVEEHYSEIWLGPFTIDMFLPGYVRDRAAAGNALTSHHMYLFIRLHLASSAYGLQFGVSTVFHTEMEPPPPPPALCS